MGWANRDTLTITVDASGDAVAYSKQVNGRIAYVEYQKDDFADTVDFTIVGEESGTNVWTEANVTASRVHAPTLAAYSPLGAARLYAAGGQAVPAPLVIAGERLKFTIAGGGNATSGTFHVVWEGG